MEPYHSRNQRENDSAAPAPHTPVATRSSLEQTILHFLQQQRSPKAAAQIVRHIGQGSQKKAVNAVLYRLLREGKVQKSMPHGSRPMWTVANRRGPPGGQGGGMYPNFSGGGMYPYFAGQFQGQGGSGQQGGYLQFQTGHFSPYNQQGQKPGYSGAPYPPYLLPSPGPPGRGGRGWVDRGTGGRGNRGRGRGRGFGNRGRGGSRYTGQQENIHGSAPNRPGFNPSQKHAHYQQALPNQKRMKVCDKKSKGDTPRGASVTEFDNGRSAKTVPKSSAANGNTVSCSSVNPATGSRDQTPAVSRAVSGAGAGAETPCPTSVLNVASACMTQTAGVSSPLPPKPQRAISDDLSDSDCEMGDCEGPTLTTRFQDIMGTLTFDEAAFDPDQEMLEEEGFLAWSGDVMGESASLAPDQIVVTTEPAGALKEREEDGVCDLTESREEEEVSHAVCPLTSSDRAQAGENLPACSSLCGEGKPLTPSQRAHQQSAPPSAFNCPPPPPPREWIDSHPAHFSSSPSPVKTHTAATVSCGAMKGGGLGRGCNPSTALLILMQARGGGRGLHSLMFSPSSPRPPGGGSVTVSGSLDVREVESSFFSSPPPAADTPAGGASTSPAEAQTVHPQDGSSSQTDPGFRNVDEFEWQPLTTGTEKPSRDTPPCSTVSSSSSSPHSCVMGQGEEGPAKRLDASHPCQPGSDALSSPHHQAVPAPSFALSPPVSADQPASTRSPVGGVDFAGTSLSPSALHPSLQRFAAEGLTLYLPSSPASSVVRSAGETSTSGGSSSVPFQKPLTPLELIEQERGQTSMAAHPCQDGLVNANAMMLSGSSSITFPQCHSRPLTSCGPVSLPAPDRREGEERGTALQISAESFAALNKNPISALMEHAQSRRMTATIDVVSQRGPSHRPVFVMSARVGNREFQRIRCHNKKDGKKEAADVALRTLIAEGQLSALTSSPSASIAAEDMTHFDRMAALTHQAFNTLIAAIPENLAGRKVIAGLVMKRGAEDQGMVISLGSGNRCITGDKLSLEGNTVNDSHAEIITRRGFLRFLYQQLLQYEEGQPHDLFEPGVSGKLRVKNGVTFHLYISTAPCGDGALFSPRDTQSNSGVVPDVNRRDHRPTFSSTVQGLLRTKMEGGEGTIPVETKDLTIQTWDGIVRGERLRTMSCTDKICRWNVLGMQGALLSHFLEPIYLDSLTLGFLYDHGHLSRAVCCRLGRGQPSLDQALAPGFRLNHPWLGRVTACQPLRETQKTKAFSINWAIGDPTPEILDGTVGHCYTGVEKKLFSRVSKRSLYDSFHQVAAHLGHSDLCGATSYRQAKMAAEGFQASKAAMFSQFRQMGCGWVKKPAEEEMFS